jgi:TolA-binding protein
VLELRPRKPAAAGAAANDLAITALKSKQTASKPYAQAIQSLLAELYDRQGRKAEAEAVRAGLTGKAATPPAVKTPPETGPMSLPAPPSSQTDVAEELRLAAAALADGGYDAAIRRIKPILTELDAKGLPKALHLLGTAEFKQAAGMPDADAARPMLLEAGLNLMRVAVLLPASPEAPLALVSAGEVNERLGNKAAASAAYEEVIRLYPDSAAARTARMGLARVKSGK